MPKQDKLQKEAEWLQYAGNRLLGRKIMGVRYLTNKEREQLGWYGRSLVLTLDDGSIIYPSRDDEGNDGGALFGQSAKGEEWTFPVL